MMANNLARSLILSLGAIEIAAGQKSVLKSTTKLAKSLSR